MSVQFFGCYFNLFRLMAKCGVLQNLLRKEHVHTFVNTGGDVRELDFRFFVGDQKIGAPFHGLKAFFTTPQLSVLDKVVFSPTGPGHAKAFGLVLDSESNRKGSGLLKTWLSHLVAPALLALFDPYSCHHAEDERLVMRQERQKTAIVGTLK